MKLAFFITVVCTTTLLGSSSYSQDTMLNLTLENVTIKDLLQEIKKQSGFSFWYNNNELDDNERITIDVQNQTVENILTVALNNKDIDFDIKDKFILIYKRDLIEGTAKNQPVRVTGVITDALTGEVLPGVNIMIKGTNQGVTSSIDGKYSIEVRDQSAVLIFSYIGYLTEEIAVSGQSVIDVVMSMDIQILDEVVVVGYGSMKKKDVTSSITSISSDDLNKGIYTDPIMRLQGKVPGLNITGDGNPNSSNSIILRGASTLRTGQAQEPFYIIDGVPGGIMPASEDIVSIDVLRDASATAIYGSRAANGVIIVTTKTGAAGQTRISYNTYAAVETVSNKIDMLSADEYRSYLSANGLSLDPEDEDDASANWFDKVSRTGLSYSHNLSLSGGNNKTTYAGNVNYIKKEGIIKGSSLNTLKLRASLEQKAMNDRLKLGVSLANSISNTETVPDELYLTMWNYLPTVNIYEEDGSFHENYNRASYNPVGLIEQNSFDGRGKVFLGTVRAQLNIAKGLDYEVSASYQNNQANNNTYYNKESALAQGYNGLAIRKSYEDEKKLLETFISYNKIIHKHDFKLLLGYSWEEDKNDNGFEVNSSNFVSDETSYYNLGLGSNYDGFVPDYGTTAMTTLRMISFYSRINYSFNDKYLLQATIRRDGSSAFGENSRWGYFPSASLGWRLIEEPFIKSLNIFDNLKLRIGYGISGNSLGFDPLISKLRYGVSGIAYYNEEYIHGIAPTQSPNPDIKWERTEMLNTGLDFSVLDGRINGTIEYYDKITKDLIWAYSVSSTEYFTATYTANAGEIENKGVEITLNTVPVKTKNFSWSTTLTVSHNKNNINTLSNNEFQLDYVYIGDVGNHGQSGMNSQIIETGHPLGQFYLWKYAGKNEEGVSQFYAADGTLTVNPSTDDRYYAGSAQPKMIGGWYNTITYRNFSLDFLFRGVSGNKVLNVTMSNLNYPAEATHYNQPRMTLNESVDDVNAHYTSTRYLEKGDYLRLDNVTLAYSFNLSTPFLKAMKLYATVNNAFIITGYDGTDPEVYLGGITPGIDNDNYYPKTRSFVFGVNVDF